MNEHRWAQRTWKEIQGLPKPSRFALLPIGATEAHGPHLPLSTDVIIAESMCQDAAKKLSSRGHNVLILPPIAYTAAPFANSFPGTISVRPETVTALLVNAPHGMEEQAQDLLI